MFESLEISHVFPVPPNVIYESWLNEYEHSNMTGGLAHIEPFVGGKFDTWDGYIRGSNIELVPHEKIIQSWRTALFPESAPDSLLELNLESIGDNTLLTLTHTNIPVDQVEDCETGWIEYYFDPMLEYFGAENLIEDN